MTKAYTHIPRRDFLSRVWAGVGLLAAVGTGYIGLRFLTSQTEKSMSDRVITAGMVDDFPPNTVAAIPNGKFYLIRGEDGGFLTLSHKCTHLACVVLWHEAEKQFYCPCHGSRFQRDGDVLNRPAVQPLTRFPVTFEDNYVLVDSGTPIERDHVETGDVAYPGEQEAAS